MKCAAHVILFEIIVVYLHLNSRIDVKGNSTFYTSNVPHNIPYSGNVWLGESLANLFFRAFGKRKFGELMDQPIGY